MPSDLRTLQALLDHQTPDSKRAGCWERIHYQIEKMKRGQTNVVIASHKIGVTFGKSGRLLGIYNWKE